MRLPFSVAIVYHCHSEQAKHAEESAPVPASNALPQSTRSLDMLVQKEYTYSYEAAELPAGQVQNLRSVHQHIHRQN